jgi:YegS/Rv2252/BmrU family lipid kinase
MGMKYVFLLNRFSLKDRLDIVRSLIEKVCKELNISYVVEINSDDVFNEDVVKKYKGEKVVLCAVGGDGIINRVLNAMDMDSNTLSFIPSGTGNDFYKSCLEQFEDGLNDCDLVSINDKYFINTCCFGIDADIANDQTFVDSKIIPRSQRYNAGIIYNFIHFNGKEMKVTINNDIFQKSFMTIAVANGKYYGRGFIMGPHARIDDGILDVYLIDNMNKLALIKVILGLKKGKHENSSKTHYFQTDKLIIESEKPLSCNYDGEKLTSKIFNIEIMPKALELYYNKELQEEFDKVKIKK